MVLQMRLDRPPPYNKTHPEEINLRAKVTWIHHYSRYKQANHQLLEALLYVQNHLIVIRTGTNKRDQLYQNN